MVLPELLSRRTIDFDGPGESPCVVPYFNIANFFQKERCKVHIVEHKQTKVQYAPKYTNKAEVAEQGLANNMLRERKLLKECDNIFTGNSSNLRYAFKDDLHRLMETNGYFLDDRAKLYFSEISCGIAYLHSLNIAHRELKRETSCFFDEFEHASLTDFNIACHYSKLNPMSSCSGTLASMVNMTGHLNAIDYWSLGILTFEMLYGYTPFSGADESETKDAIRKNPLVIPEESKSPVSEEANDILKALLTREPWFRLGADDNGGVRKLRAHAWFRNWDWEKAENREITVPFLPDTKNNMYYNPILELEEALFEDNPLQSRPVHLKNKDRLITKSNKITTGDELAAEDDGVVQLRMLTDEFKDFNFTKVVKPDEAVSMLITTSLDGLVDREANH
ncbi:kinase-like domain-containing protein [Chytriomyces sp. MP71]|nr:kinase-like domain-containing protein [Chytriomyces sp. MP71]